MDGSFIEFDLYELAMIQQIMSDYEIETGDNVPLDIKLRFKNAQKLLLNGGVGGFVYQDGRTSDKWG